MLSTVDVSVVIPIHNAEKWLDECLQSVFSQVCNCKIEISIFLDSCTDDSQAIVSSWILQFSELGIKVTVSSEDNYKPMGVGYAKNKAVYQSCGEFLCFLDADDVMLEDRIQKQYELAYSNHNAIVGCKFFREPSNSTGRYTKWANNLTSSQLLSQIYTSHGPTIIMPTWFCHRSVFHKVNGFEEKGRGTPEDLIFFYKHLRLGGDVICHSDYLLMYRYHSQATTFSISEDTIWNLRINEIQENVLRKWERFSIWNAGKQGRKFFRSLRKENQLKVSYLCDVDQKKVGTFYTYEESSDIVKPKIPIIHFSEVKPPLIICMKLDLTGGNFEENLATLNLQEGIDYFHFN